MFYTLTLNPSLDYLLDTPEITLGKTNRSISESLHFGGKGINVSYILKQLGIPSVCLGFTAGFTGTELEEMLKKQGLETDFIRLCDGNTRINIKIKNEGITEINAKGPQISQTDMARLFEKLDRLTAGDTLILAGSTPKGFDDIYEKIMRKLSDKKVRIILDTSGKKLLSCLKYKPFLIKPNIDELSEILERELISDEEIASAAMELHKSGAANVLVSMGDRGAMLIDEHGAFHRQEAKKITPLSTVGAGDSMIAGFLAGLENGYEYALALGCICGAATASCEMLADKEQIQALM